MNIFKTKKYAHIFTFSYNSRESGSDNRRQKVVRSKNKMLTLDEWNEFSKPMQELYGTEWVLLNHTVITY